MPDGAPYRGAGPIGMRHPGAVISGVTCRLAKSPAGQQLAARGMRCHYRESKRIPPGPHEHSAPAPIRIVDDNHNKAMGNASAGRAARRGKRAGSTTGAVGDRRTGCAHVVGHRRARGGTGNPAPQGAAPCDNVVALQSWATRYSLVDGKATRLPSRASIHSRALAASDRNQTPVLALAAYSLVLTDAAPPRFAGCVTAHAHMA